MALLVVCAGMLLYCSVGWLLLRGLHYKMLEREEELAARQRVKDVIYKTQDNPELQIWNCRQRWMRIDREDSNLPYIESFMERYHDMKEVHGNNTTLVLYLSVGMFWLPSLIKGIIENRERR